MMTFSKWGMGGSLASTALGLCLIGPILAAEPGTRSPLGSGFSFQGRLMDNASPANGSFDLEFRLFDDAGNPAGDPNTVEMEDVVLVDGLFTVELNFGSSAFDGQNRNVEVGVRPGASSGAFTTLAPRQRLTASPHALSLRSVQLESRPGSAFVAAPETQIGTAGDPALVVADTASSLRKGNLGVGTAAPVAKLNVVGGQAHLLRIEQTSNSFNPVLELKDASPAQNISPAINFLNGADQVPGQLLYSMFSNSMVFRTNGLERMRIDSSGNLGLGTGAPAARLNVVGAQPSLLRIEQTSNSWNPVLELKDASPGQGGFPAINFLGASNLVPGQILYSMAGAYMNFRVNDQYRMLIDAGGSVRIGAGTVAPSAMLHVVGSHAHMLRVEQTSDSFNSVLELKDASPGQAGLTSINFLNGTDLTPGQLLYSMGSNTMTFRVNSAERMRIDANGNVGIGTTGPVARLEVETSSGLNTAIRGGTSLADGFGVVGFATASTGAGRALYGQTSASGGTGAYGLATASTGSNYGVYGSSSSSSGTGTAGFATAGSGTTTGVYGETVSSSGRGVRGKATATSGSATGVLGESAGSSGYGVYGIASATSGTNFGVFGTSPSISGTGLRGLATSVSGPTAGVSGEAFSTAARGVSGKVTALTGNTYGVYGESASSTGTGVYGLATGTTDRSYGVSGFSVSPQGIGVLGANYRTTGYTTGVFGEVSSPNGTAVYGLASSTTGTGAGVSGVTFSAANGAAAISASAPGASGETYGLYATDNSPAGYGAVVVNTADGGTVLKLRKTSSQYSGNLITAERAGDTEFRVFANGNVYADGSYNCGLSTESACLNAGLAADVAERIDVTGTLEPGDVVAIDPNREEHFLLCRDSFSTLVAGVVSTSPAITMANNDLTDNDALDRSDNRPLLALAGRVPVKVSAENGPIRIGDLLVASSTPGHAMRAGDEPPAGSVVGKALQPLKSGTGVIKMLVQPR